MGASLATHRGSLVGLRAISSPARTCELIAVKADGERSVVHERNLHVRPKNTASHMADIPLCDGAEVLIEPSGHAWGRSVREAWPASTPTVGKERELAHDEHLPIDVGEREVDLARLVLKDTQVQDLVPERLGAGLVIVVPHAKKDKIALRAASHDLARHLDRGTPHALDDRPHEQIPLQAIEGRELLGEVVGVVARREGLFAGVPDELP